MRLQTLKTTSYLAQAEKCDAEARRATRPDIREAYRSLADQWRDLARQAGELGPAAMDWKKSTN